MTPREQFELDVAVSKAIGKRPGESIADCARRELWKTRGNRRKACRVLLREDGAPWARMREAARLLAAGGGR